MFLLLALVGLLTSSLFAASVTAFSASSNTNLAVYWGQGSGQKPLANFCSDDTIDIIPIGFMNIFPDQDGSNGYPGTNFGNACGGTYLNNGQPTEFLGPCTFIEADIKTCQTNGKKILLSLGGGSSTNVFIEDDDSAIAFANFLWGAFGPLSSSWGGPRPFGDAVIDGFDFDIESFENDIPSTASISFGYDIMANQLRSLFAGSPGTYYLSASPQCVVPDSHLAIAIDQSPFDWLFVQFYNTDFCSARAHLDDTFGEANNGGHPTDISFDAWAKFVSESSSSAAAKIFLGLPAAPDAASANMYLSPDEATSVTNDFMCKYKDQFGGIMLWEATYSDQNVVNGKTYAQNMKEMLLVNSCASPIATSTTTTTTWSTTISLTTTVTTTGLTTLSTTTLISSSSTCSSSSSNSAMMSTTLATSTTMLSSTSSSTTSSVSTSSSIVGPISTSRSTSFSSSTSLSISSSLSSSDTSSTFATSSLSTSTSSLTISTSCLSTTSSFSATFGPATTSSSTSSVSTTSSPLQSMSSTLTSSIESTSTTTTRSSTSLITTTTTESSSTTLSSLSTLSSFATSTNYPSVSTSTSSSIVTTSSLSTLSTSSYSSLVTSSVSVAPASTSSTSSVAWSSAAPVSSTTNTTATTTTAWWMPIIVTTVLTTSYTDICSTGFTAVPWKTTTTFISYVGVTTTAAAPATGCPEGFTTTVTVCTVCGPAPTTCTLTKPIGAPASPPPIQTMTVVPIPWTGQPAAPPSAPVTNTTGTVGWVTAGEGTKSWTTSTVSLQSVPSFMPKPLTSTIPKVSIIIVSKTSASLAMPTINWSNIRPTASVVTEAMGPAPAATSEVSWNPVSIYDPSSTASPSSASSIREAAGATSSPINYLPGNATPFFGAAPSSRMNSMLLGAGILALLVLLG